MCSEIIQGNRLNKMNQKKVAVFGDLTALYHARKEIKKNINYNHIDSAIKKACGITKFDCANWYTLFHPENQSQVNFVKTLEALDWTVKTKRPSQIRRVGASNNPHTDYRFDAQIAYNIGEATGEFDKIVVVSDSLELLIPLQEATEFVDVTLSFFTEAMDRRWFRPLDESKIKFLNLGEMLHSSREDELVQDSARFE